MDSPGICGSVYIFFIKFHQQINSQCQKQPTKSGMLRTRVFTIILSREQKKRDRHTR